MNDEIEFLDLDDELELENESSHKRVFKQGINLDARRRLEIYLEEKALQQHLVDFDAL